MAARTKLWAYKNTNTISNTLLQMRNDIMWEKLNFNKPFEMQIKLAETSL